MATRMTSLVNNMEAAVEVDGLVTFLKSIDWSDTWLSALLVFHALTILTVYVSRNSGSIQSFLFFAFLLMVYFSEHLNELGAKHWRSFSKQQYFDSSGMFISLVFSFPLLLNCTVIVCYWLFDSGRLLIKLKRAQLLKTAKENSDNKNK